MRFIERSPRTVEERPKDALQARLRERVVRLAIPRHARVHAPENAWVRAELEGELRDCGLEVSVQGPFGNVLALPRDRAPLTLVAAHYDSVPWSPGADDNASGLAALLECARAGVSGVGFVAFNAEEDGLLGSRDFVANTLPALGRELRAVHVLEMLGYRGDAPTGALPLPWTPASLRVPDFLAVIGKHAANGDVERAIESERASALRVVGLKTWGPLHRWVPDLERSDHFPFWAAGLPALLWTDTGDLRNPNYHRREDTPDTLDYGFLADVTEVLLDVLTTPR